MASTIDIIELRKQLGWSQGQLAEHLGLDRSTISRIEHGQQPSGPVLKLLLQLASRRPSREPSHPEETAA